MFRVETLGSSGVSRSDGSQVLFRSRKHFALLVHLAISGPRAHRRERLVGLLWPEDGDARARHSLSQALYALRRLFGEEVVEVRGEEVQIGSGRPAVDALEFGEHLRRGAIADAVALYRGEFLEGFWVRGARPFEDWMDRERARLAAEFRQALRSLIRDGREQGEWAAVVERTRRLIQIEPYDEHAYADLMRALWIVGDRAGALKQYEVLREVLAGELESEPGPEIEELAARIRRRSAEAKRREGERRAEPAISEPPFVGRKEEYARLLAVWRRVTEGHAAGVVLTGEPGIGKTRLAEEFLRYVATEDALVLRGACYPFLQGVPYAPFAEALRPLILDTALIRKLEPMWQSQLAQLFVELSGPQERATDEARRATGIRLQFEAVAQLLQVSAARRPMVLFVDNLQWADSGSASLAHFLLLRLHGVRFFALLTSREDVSRQWLSWPVDPGNRLTWMRLPPLSRMELERLVGEVLPAIPPDQAYLLSRGNPFFALELCTVYALRAEQAASPVQRHGGADLTRVRDVQAIIERRLDLLTARDRRVLEAASVVGEPISVAALQRTSSLEMDTLADAIQSLADAGFLVHSGPQLEFAHDLVHETVYEMLPEVRRRILHGRVASALDGMDAPDVIAKQAWHFDRAGERPRALATAMTAARAATERCSYHEAQPLAEIAARNASTSRERLDCMYLLGETVFFQRRYSAARSYLEEARVLAQELDDRELQLKIQNLLWRSDLDSSDRPVPEIVAAASALIGSEALESASARTRMDFAMVLLGAGTRAGDVDAARRAVELAEDLGRYSSDPYEVGRMLRARGLLEGLVGNIQTSVSLLQRRVRLAEEARNAAEELEGLIDLGVVLTLSFSLFEETKTVHLRGVSLSDKLGDPLMRGRARNNWGSTLMDWGYFEDAKRVLSEALEILSPHSELLDMVQLVEANLGQVSWLFGHIDAAERHWRRASQLSGASQQIAVWRDSPAGMGLCVVARGDEATAREYCAEALRRLRRWGSLPGELQNAYLLWAAVSLMRGRRDKAIAAIRRAARALKESKPANYLKLIRGALRLFEPSDPGLAGALARELRDYAAQRSAYRFIEEIDGAPPNRAHCEATPQDREIPSPAK